jgi:hypothetical protein
MAKSKKTTEENVKEWTPPAKAPKYRVAKGKAISCRKGIRSEGDPIEAINVGGEECLEKLIKSGHVEKY